MSTRKYRVPLFVAYWGEGYPNEHSAVALPIESFSKDYGYDTDAQARVVALDIGASVDLSDLSGVHKVWRVA